MRSDRRPLITRRLDLGRGGRPVGEVADARLARPANVGRADLRSSDPSASSPDGGHGIPPASPCVLGVDLSSHAIDFAKVDENTNTVRWTQLQLHGDNAWARTLQIGNLRGDGLTFEDVYLVAVEAPYGRGQAGTLAILNRVVGAVAAVLPPRLRTPATCWIVRPDEWKNGLGLKAKPTQADIARLLEPAHDVPDDQNARDAACLALWARDVNAAGIAKALQGAA